MSTASQLFRSGGPVSPSTLQLAQSVTHSASQTGHSLLHQSRAEQASLPSPKSQLEQTIQILHRFVMIALDKLGRMRGLLRSEVLNSHGWICYSQVGLPADWISSNPSPPAQLRKDLPHSHLRHLNLPNWDLRDWDIRSSVAKLNPIPKIVIPITVAVVVREHEYL